MKDNVKRLLTDVRNQISQLNIPNAERYEANVVAFLNQCPNDFFLQDAKVEWDGQEKFDFYWDTIRLDCSFSVGLEKTSWHFWAGVNTHKQDDECYQHGFGGMSIEGNEDDFAFAFFDSMSWEIDRLGKYK